MADNSYIQSETDKRLIMAIEQLSEEFEAIGHRAARQAVDRHAKILFGIGAAFGSSLTGLAGLLAIFLHQLFMG